MNCCCSTSNDLVYIGYYPLRGKAQICRLLCEYLHVPYKDLLFTPQCWEKYKKTEVNDKWTFAELPFLKDGDFIATQTFPISLYLINKANRKDLLGRSLEDESKVDIFICQCQVTDNLLGYYVSMKEKNEEQKRVSLQKFWHCSIAPKLAVYEKNTCQNFYLGYISLIDFYFYEMIYLLLSAFPHKIINYPKLMRVYQTMCSISEIKAYEESSRAVKKLCPIMFCNEWKERCCSEN